MKGEEQVEEVVVVSGEDKVDDERREVVEPASMKDRRHRGHGADVFRGLCSLLSTPAARRPYRTMCLCVGVMMVLGLGWFFVDEEENEERLWSTQDTRSKRDRRFIEDHFGNSLAGSVVYLQGSDVLTKSALLEAFDIYDLVMNLEINDARWGYDRRLCAPVYWTSEPLLCQKESVLALWNYNRTLLELDDDVLATVNSPKQDCCSPLSLPGRRVDVNAVVGRRYYDDGQLLKASALRMAFYLKQDRHRKTRTDPRVGRLERKFERRLRRRRWTHFRRPLPLTEAGYVANVQAAFDHDAVLAMASFFLITAYAFGALVKIRSQRNESRGLLALGSVVTSTLATVGAFGAGIFFGLTFSSSTYWALFISIAIGLDDSFVLLADAQTTHDDVRTVMNGAPVDAVAADRVLVTVKDAGPSIATTTVTDACAFAAASFSRVPDISNFTRFCCAAVIVDFFMQCTFFVALFTLDQRSKLHAAAFRREEHFFVVAGELREEPSVRGGDFVVQVETLEAPVPKKKSVAAWYARSLMTPVGKAVVLAASGVLITLSFVGLARVTIDVPSNINVYGGYVEKALTFQKKYFNRQDTLYVAVVTKRADYFAARDDLQKMIHDYASARYVVDESIVGRNWFHAYEAFFSSPAAAAKNKNSTTWLVGLREFLDSDDGAEYKAKVSFDADGEIQATTMDSYWVRNDQTTLGDVMRRMQKSRNDVDGFLILDTVAVYADMFIWSDTLAEIEASTPLSVGVSSAVVAVLLVALLGHLGPALLVAVQCALIACGTLGSIWWYGDAINYVTRFYLVIAIGLGVDAPAHVCRAFLDSQKQGQAKVQDALERIGPSLIRGTLSTALAVLIAVIAHTYTFQSLFRYMTTILVLSLWYGLVLLPVLLALFAPRPTSISKPISDRRDNDHLSVTTEITPNDDDDDEDDDDDGLDVEKRDDDDDTRPAIELRRCRDPDDDDDDEPGSTETNPTGDKCLRRKETCPEPPEY